MPRTNSLLMLAVMLVSCAPLAWADGVMVGRAAYHNPDLLREIEAAMYGTHPTLSKLSILARYRDYVVAQLDRGERLHSLTRHLLSSCNGLRMTSMH